MKYAEFADRLKDAVPPGDLPRNLDKLSGPNEASATSGGVSAKLARPALSAVLRLRIIL
ncbi:MAG: hypothetical protein QXP98_10165 [Thermoproteus sp.]